jgi:acyl-CoA reductase-like NAD-dependent aldehyde dehydrogenase
VNAKPLLASKSFEIAGSPGARTATPAIIAVDASDESLFGQEQFGPISFMVAVGTARDAIDTAARLARTKGAIPASVYSTSAEVLEEAADKFAAAGVNLSCNLTGLIFVNQSAAFSDYHVTGANPSGNACLTDTAFVASRFRVAGVRRPAAVCEWGGMRERRTAAPRCQQQ